MDNNKDMNKEQVFAQYNISYDKELWEDETISQIRKWFKWFKGDKTRDKAKN